MNRGRGSKLRRAYRSVAYGADAAWAADQCALQRASLALRLREDLVASRTSLNRLLPRTVRDAIPESRLAHYGDYEYVKNRELCYTPAAAAHGSADRRRHDPPDEPWMLREVDDLFARFTDYKDEFRESTLTGLRPYDVFRSPFFEARTSEEIVLKLKTVGVKRYWETDKSFHSCNPLITKEKILCLYKSHTGNIIVLEENPSVKYTDEETFFKDIPEIDRYFSHLKELSQSFKEQTFWITTTHRQQQQYHSDAAHALGPWLDASQDYDLDHPHRRLYSAVLQGACSQKPATVAAAGLQPADGRMVLLGKSQNYDAILGRGGARPAATTTTPPTGAALLAQLALQHAQAAAYRAHWAWLGHRDHAHHRPLAPSRSEELELQALRQYSASETELEREAAEQYDGPPENWRRPPNREPFGGWAAAAAPLAARC